jgi:hypothetical protein
MKQAEGYFCRIKKIGGRARSKVVIKNFGRKTADLNVK